MDAWFDMMAWVCLVNPGSNGICAHGGAFAARVLITSPLGCGLSLAPACGYKARLEAEFVIKNLAWAWCVANPDACHDLIVTALAVQLAIDVHEINRTWTGLSYQQGSAAHTRRLLQNGVTVTANDMIVSVSNLTSKISQSLHNYQSVNGNSVTTPAGAQTTLGQPTNITFFDRRSA